MYRFARPAAALCRFQTAAQATRSFSRATSIPLKVLPEHPERPGADWDLWCGEDLGADTVVADQMKNSVTNTRGRIIDGTLYQKGSRSHFDFASKTSPRLSKRFVQESIGMEKEDSMVVGDKLSFRIDEHETSLGDLLCKIENLEEANSLQIWEHLKERYDAGHPLIGRILNPIKGGFCVGFGGYTAFLPNSHLVKGRSPSYSHWLKRTRPYIGALLYFKILELNPIKRNFVISRTEALTPEGTLKIPAPKKVPAPDPNEAKPN